MKEQIARAKRNAGILRFAVRASAALTMGIAVLIVGYIVIKGVPNLTPELFAWEYSSENASLTHALVNTLTMTVLGLLLAVPVGVSAAIFLTEYAGRESRLVRLIRITAETLQGIPSIIYGLFGALFFAAELKMGLSLGAGALTLALMTLPVILRTAEEALLCVPMAYREGSFALGAGRLRTVFRVVLPSAMPGILAGVILAMGRMIGETAALIYTAGTATKVAGLADSGRTLSVHMYILAGEGLYTNQAFATAFVLLVMAAALNGLSVYAAKKLSRKKHDKISNQ